MKRREWFRIVILLSVAGAAAAQAPQAEEDEHKANIHGIEVGMDAQQALDKMGGRMPDGRKDEKEGFMVQWKQEDGSVLRVIFRKENVTDVFVQYKVPLPTADLHLAPQFSPASRSELTVQDPRVRREYKVTQTDDQQRTVWTREEKTPAGYRVQVRFLSGAKKQHGNQYEESVEFKYVSLVKDDLKKFESAVAAGTKP